jgi:hypothetical protein
MDAEAQDAFAHLIQGDLSTLLNAGQLAAGISKAGSIMDRLKDAKHTFKFNFLGLFDYASVQDSILDMATKVSDDGQVILTDTAHLTRLAADTTPLVKGDQLRKVIAEDAVATVGYAASFGSTVPQLTVNYSYYQFERNARSSDLTLFSETATAMDEPGVSGDWQELEDSGINSQQASFFANLTYDQASSCKLFVDENANARPISDLEKVGRLATLATPELNLNQSFRSLLEDDAKWQTMRDDGSTQGLYAILGVDEASPPAWAIVSSAWYSHIVSWSSAMHSAGQALQSVLQYLSQNPEVDLVHDQSFLKRRQTFASQLSNAINAAPLFKDSLGLLTVYKAAAPASKSVVITYGGVAKSYT